MTDDPDEPDATGEDPTDGPFGDGPDPTTPDEDPESTDDEPEPTTPYVTEEYTHEADDGTELAVRVFRPEASGVDDPVPILLQRTPYGRPEEVTGNFRSMALDAGYALVFEDVRGRGDSGGEFLPWVYEADDGRATIEWLADRPWSTGDVGTFGGSSPGQVQLFAAAERPEGLRAISPMFTPSDLHRADFFQDGAMSALTFLTWSLDDSVAGHTVDRLEDDGTLSADVAEQCREALDAALDRLPELARHRPLNDLVDDVLADVDLPDGVTPGDVVPHWDAWTGRPEYDDFWRSFDPEPEYGRIEVPGLHGTGWWELCQSGTLANFAGLRDRSPAPQHLVVGPWAHQFTGPELGDLDFGEDASLMGYGYGELQLAFFDAHVRGDGEFYPDGDRLVETFRTTVIDGENGEGGGEWTAHHDWPPTDATTERWYLHSDGDAAANPEDGVLDRRRPAKFEPADEYTHDPTDPVPTRGGPLCCGESSPDPGPVDQRPVEARSDVCTYTTAPLSEPLELAGPVTLRLTAITTAPDTDFTGKLVHVTDDGPAYNLCEGIRRVRYRHGRDRPVPIEPGEPFRVEIDLWASHHRIPAGDRLRLEVASSNHPRFDPHPGTTDPVPWETDSEDVRIAEQTVFHETDRESVLELTVRR
ncbi:MAG TPA: CocE/NonD family hydrolase [Natrialbaceae archaeon]|nr:CocE/NonD family hydrolase [Natrialbaceae archaeon]